MHELRFRVVPMLSGRALLEAFAQEVEPPFIDRAVQVEKQDDPGRTESGGIPIADEWPDENDQRNGGEKSGSDDGRDLARLHLARIRGGDVKQRVRTEDRHVPWPTLHRFTHLGMPEVTRGQELYCRCCDRGRKQHARVTHIKYAVCGRSRKQRFVDAYGAVVGLRQI